MMQTFLILLGIAGVAVSLLVKYVFATLRRTPPGDTPPRQRRRPASSPHARRQAAPRRPLD
jgi:hypothetical protein